MRIGLMLTKFTQWLRRPLPFKLSEIKFKHQYTSIFIFQQQINKITPIIHDLHWVFTNKPNTYGIAFRKLSMQYFDQPTNCRVVDRGEYI